jgi:hypothetical protein
MEEEIASFIHGGTGGSDVPANQPCGGLGWWRQPFPSHRVAGAATYLGHGVAHAATPNLDQRRRRPPRGLRVATHATHMTWGGRVSHLVAGVARRPPQLLYLWLLSWPSSSPSVVAHIWFGFLFLLLKFLHFFLMDDVSRVDWWATNP